MTAEQFEQLIQMVLLLSAKLDRISFALERLAARHGGV